MCEPLKNKKTWFDETNAGSNWNSIQGFYLKDIVSTYTFYKRYRDNPHWLKLKYPDIWNTIDDKEIYEHWLFEYCFGNII